MVKNHYIGFISNGKGTLSRGKKKRTTTKMGKLRMRNIIGKKKKKKRKTYKVVDQPFIKL